MPRCLNCMNEYVGNGDYCPKCGFKRNTPPKEVYHLYPGTELAGRYIIGTVVGFGGFGIVYKAWDNMMASVVAIKEYFPVSLASRDPDVKIVNIFEGKRYEEFKYGKERFLNEARIMAKFNTHENIVGIYDFFDENNTGYIVMEFLEGVSLRQYLKMEGNPLDIETAIGITESICDILHVIHQEGILHRDISPDNIFICLGGKIKLIDFGASRLPKINPNLTRILKPGYAPPEQYSSEKIQGSWTDVYALGATLYRMLTGKVPLESTDRNPENDQLERPKNINSNIPEYLDIVIMRAMTIRPELRYQNVLELKKALRDEKGAVDEHQELKRRKRNRRISIGFVVCMILVGIFIAIGIYYEKKEKANLPDAEITMWVPISNVTYNYYDSTAGSWKEAQNYGGMENVLEEFDENYGDHVKINIIEIEEEEYYDRLKKVKGTENMPDIFYMKYFDDKYTKYLADISNIKEDIDNKDYFFSSDIKKCIEENKMIPTGINCFVLYKNTNVEEADETGGYVFDIYDILLEQSIEGQEKYYQNFLNGQEKYYIGLTDQYQEIMESHKISSYIEIEEISEFCNYGFLSDFWCVSKYSSSEQKTCSKAILRYLIDHNCQRIFFTVNNSRISNSMPINKDIFEVNYYENSVSYKMDFIKVIVNKMDIDIRSEDIYAQLYNILIG